MPVADSGASRLEGQDCRPMALAWHPLTPALIGTVTSLARAPWDAGGFDQAWLQTGWPTPPGGSVLDFVKDITNWPVLNIGDWEVTFPWGPWADDARPKMLDLTFALFYEPDEDEDPDWVELPQTLPSARWRVDRSGNREQFNTVWRSGLVTISQVHGKPQDVGVYRDGDEWSYAIWHMGARLLVLSQGEDFQTHSLYDRATLHIADRPPGSPIPLGGDLYGLLMGGEGG